MRSSQATKDQAGPKGFPAWAQSVDCCRLQGFSNLVHGGCSKQLGEIFPPIIHYNYYSQNLKYLMIRYLALYGFVDAPQTWVDALSLSSQARRTVVLDPELTKFFHAGGDLSLSTCNGLATEAMLTSLQSGSWHVIMVTQTPDQ